MCFSSSKVSNQENPDKKILQIPSSHQKNRENVDYKEAEVWCQKAKTFCKLNKPEEALSCYDEALTINPKFLDAWYNKGDKLDVLGKYNEAII